MTKLISFQKTVMSKRPTFEQLLNDSVLNPKDKIALPNRMATQLRNMQQLNKWDDPHFIDLDEQSKNITINQIHNQEVHHYIQQSPDTTRAEHHATQPPPPPPDFPMQPPPPHPPHIPKYTSTATSTEDTVMAASGPHGKPPPPPAGGGIKRTSTQAQPPPRKAEYFDMTIDDDMSRRRDDFSDLVAFHESQIEANRRAAVEQNNRLLSDIRNQVSDLVDSRLGRGRSREPRRPRAKTPDVTMETTTNNPPPPPPGAAPVLQVAASGATKKSIGVKKQPKAIVYVRKPAAKKQEDDISAEVSGGKPPPPPPPAPVVVRIPKSRSPRRGRSASRPISAPPSSTPQAAATTEVKAITAPIAAGPLPPRSGAGRTPKRAKSVAPAPPKPTPAPTVDTTQKRVASTDVPRPTKKKTEEVVSAKPKPTTAPVKIKPSTAPVKVKPSTKPRSRSAAKSAEPIKSPPNPTEPPPRERTRSAIPQPSRLPISGRDKRMEDLVNRGEITGKDADRVKAIIAAIRNKPSKAERKDLVDKLGAEYRKYFGMLK